MSSVLLPIPPLAEQQVIAKALADADSIIAATQQLVAKKRALQLGALHDLLAGTERLPGFESRLGNKTTAAGMIPEDWQIDSFGASGRWFSGSTPRMSYQSYWLGDIPWVSPKDMKRPRLYDAIDHITENAVRDGSKLLPVGAILIVVRGMILAHSLPIARAERPLAFNQDIKAIVPNHGIDSNFLLYWLSANEKRLRSLVTESTHGTKRLPTEMLFRELVAYPSVEEQKAIAAVLSDMDAEIEALEQKLHKARQIKQAMMQELLTGRIRLI
jgi:type I restriction enzyme S subunit